MSYKNYSGELQGVLSPKPVVDTTKGTDIMGKMLLSQYSNSDLFKSYLLAFVEEMDILFEQVEEVYLGRFIEFAVGEQLDVIGVILNQSRAVSLPKTYFGFQGAVSPEKMSDEAAPSDGGYFKGEEEENFQITPLDDATYRRLLFAKAYANRLESCSIDETYLLSRILLGSVPRKLQIMTNTSVDGTVAKQNIELHLSAEDTTNSQSALLYYFRKYMVPLGTTFNIIRS
tara:strand:- start:89 stop:775 length:687 start_codon:yes stop_codon:yes gene_type:complete